MEYRKTSESNKIFELFALIILIYCSLMFAIFILSGLKDVLWIICFFFNDCFCMFSPKPKYQVDQINFFKFLPFL